MCEFCELHLGAESYDASTREDLHHGRQWQDISFHRSRATAASVVDVVDLFAVGGPKLPIAYFDAVFDEAMTEPKSCCNIA